MDLQPRLEYLRNITDANLDILSEVVENIRLGNVHIPDGEDLEKNMECVLILASAYTPRETKIRTVLSEQFIQYLHIVTPYVLKHLCPKLKL